MIHIIKLLEALGYYNELADNENKNENKNENENESDKLANNENKHENENENKNDEFLEIYNSLVNQID